MRVLVSGGFDPYHDGHAQLIELAAMHGEVVVALNSDAWLTRKKGKPFMPWDARASVMLSVKGVQSVYPVHDDDGTVCEAIRTIRPDAFANGGDRGADNTPEAALCEAMGVRLLYGLGDKIRSSSELIRGLTVERGWGTYRVLAEGPGYKVKLIEVRPGCATSLQTHKRRAEHWEFVDEGDYRRVGRDEWHRLQNNGRTTRRVIEIQTGQCDESDIVRMEPAIIQQAEAA